METKTRINVQKIACVHELQNVFEFFNVRTFLCDSSNGKTIIFFLKIKTLIKSEPKKIHL